ncbi:uncharacterized protein LOC135120715 [Zophobas morio]|uniref:uncharacterized protein LOC135120715 n=1 Tax=Zophobas morio TaxID=2755281 RepID=UPI003082DBCD
MLSEFKFFASAYPEKARYLLLRYPHLAYAVEQGLLRVDAIDTKIADSLELTDPPSPPPLYSPILEEQFLESAQPGQHQPVYGNLPYAHPAAQNPQFGLQPAVNVFSGRTPNEALPLKLPPGQSQSGPAPSYVTGSYGGQTLPPSVHHPLHPSYAMSQQQTLPDNSSDELLQLVMSLSWSELEALPAEERRAC